MYTLFDNIHTILAQGIISRKLVSRFQQQDIRQFNGLLLSLNVSLCKNMLLNERPICP